MSTPSSSTATATPARVIPGTGLTRLYTDGLPYLKGRSPRPEDIAIWCRNICRWGSLSGYAHYFEEPLTATPCPILARDALRYVYLSIESESLRGALADRAYDSASEAIAYVRSKWLHGQSESTILKRKIQTLTCAAPEHMQTFLADFLMCLTHITPPLQPEDAADLIDAALPDHYDHYCQNARANPGIKSKRTSAGVIKIKESIEAYGDEIASQVARSEAIASQVARSEARRVKLALGNIIPSPAYTTLSLHKPTLTKPSLWPHRKMKTHLTLI